MWNLFHWGQHQLKTWDVWYVKHTCVFNVFNEIEGTVGICTIDWHGVVKEVSVIKCCSCVEEFKCSFVCFDGPSHTFLTQVSHKKLKADEGKNSKSKDSQNHDVHHFLHWLDQSSHDGFQTWQNTMNISVSLKFKQPFSNEWKVFQIIPLIYQLVTKNHSPDRIWCHCRIRKLKVEIIPSYWVIYSVAHKKKYTKIK